MLNLFFPKLCVGCKNELANGEEIICGTCRHRLPLTDFHTHKSPELKNKFYGRIPVSNATALLYFNKRNLTQAVLHQLKYKGNAAVGVVLGKWLGQELAVLNEYQNIDLVVPVPLHKKKLKSRGYNQVEGFAREIAHSLNATYRDDILIKITPTSSQVFSERITRIFSREEVFSVVQPQEIVGKHILITDDIITTGATIEACAGQLLKAPGVTISIASMAVTE
ncbi:MAG TPA: hypothetical protein VKZ42_06420 [Flavobacteriaceae bacterium]|nr:hypothetical protein [Flavobacteriaceae bacterium]